MTFKVNKRCINNKRNYFRTISEFLCYRTANNDVDVRVYNIHESYDRYMVFGKFIITKCKWLAHQT